MKVTDTCPHCGEALHHQRADDAPPYFTIFIVGHIMIPLVLIVERVWQPSYLVHAMHVAAADTWLDIGAHAHRKRGGCGPAMGPGDAWFWL